MDLAKVLALIGSFALLVTAHVALAAGLARKRPRWRSPVALLVPPLALYWGHGAGMRLRSALWLGSLVLYLAALAAASF